MRETNIVWTASDGNTHKDSSWYWTIGIVAGGVAVAAFIIGNFLLGVLAILGAFVIMLAGSQPEKERRYAITEKGVHLDNVVVPFQNIKRFSIQEEEPRKLCIETAGLMGVVSIPLMDTDYRNIRSQLKNHNIDEEDELGSFTEKITDMLGV